jgi:serine/threonine protein kinase/Flp pilus assembly protein TadD
MSAIEAMPDAADGTATEAGVTAPAGAGATRSAAYWSNQAGQAFEEYWDRLEGGEQLDPEEFCARYPAPVQRSLRRLVLTHGLLYDNVKAESGNKSGWPAPGEVFLGFTLRQRLGEGGFARVYLATEPALGDRPVVVKLSLLGGAEAATLGRLRHANVIDVHSVQQDPVSGLTAICMPFLGAATLDTVLDHAFVDGRPTAARVILDAARSGAASAVPEGVCQAPARVLQRGSYVEGVYALAGQIADALAFIHGRGICHQDLKPSNVLLRPDGRPVLLDFNLSRDPRGDLGLPGGTIPYMSPEQLRMFGPEEVASLPDPDLRWDLFAFGVIVYELLAGALPFGPAPLGIPDKAMCGAMLQRQHAGLRPLRQAAPEVDRAVARLVERCLALDPEQRPQAAAEVAAVFRRALSAPRRARRWAGRHPWATTALVCFALALGGGAAVLQAQRDPPGVAQVRQGWSAYHHGEFKKAEEQFNQALQANPQLAEALFARGRARQQMGDRLSLNGALNDYRQACQLAPDAKIYACMGYCLNCLGDERAAAGEYQRAVAAGFRRAEVYNNLAYGYLRLARFAEARQSLDEAIRLDPHLPAVYHNRAVYFFRMASQLSWRTAPKELPDGLKAQVRKGLADVEKALELGPGHAELYHLAGLLCALRAGACRDERALKQGLDYLARAVAAGEDPARLAENPEFQPFRDEAAFKALLQRRPAGHVQPTRLTRVVDPLQDRVR